MQLLESIESALYFSSLTGFIVAFFYFLSNLEKLNMIHHDSNFFMTFLIQQIDTMKDKSVPFIDIFNPI